MTEARRHPIVANGQERIRENERVKIRQEVAVRYAKAMASAGRLRRLWIRLRMAREIRRELNEFAPDRALYARDATRYVRLSSQRPCVVIKTAPCASRGSVKGNTSHESPTLLPVGAERLRKRLGSSMMRPVWGNAMPLRML